MIWLRNRFIRLLTLLSFTACLSITANAALPDAALDTAKAKGSDQSIVLAGGCFWGIEAVYRHTKGVKESVSGYAGGAADTANYHTVSSGETGHAESVKVTYDPAQITLGQILKIYFAVAHDPTELNRQGSDTGTQYRSTIFFSNAEQKKIAQGYIDQLQTAKAFDKPIVTKLEALDKFYPAENYHQNYAALHPMQPYIFINDAPKVKNLAKEFPDLYVEK